MTKLLYQYLNSNNSIFSVSCKTLQKIFAKWRSDSADETLNLTSIFLVNILIYLFIQGDFLTWLIFPVLFFNSQLIFALIDQWPQAQFGFLEEHFPS